MAFAALLAALALGACTGPGLNRGDGVFAPGVAGESDIDGLIVGHRLMAAGEYELALKAYSRAAVQQGFNVDTLSALGSANLQLGRLGQAERLLRRAVEEDPDFAPAWNNLGVVLMNQGKVGEAAIVFRRAFATDSGQSEEIRQNLLKALALLEQPGYDPSQNQGGFTLLRRGAGDFLLLSEA